MGVPGPHLVLPLSARSLPAALAVRSGHAKQCWPTRQSPLLALGGLSLSFTERKGRVPFSLRTSLMQLQCHLLSTREGPREAEGVTALCPSAVQTELRADSCPSSDLVCEETITPSVLLSLKNQETSHKNPVQGCGSWSTVSGVPDSGIIPRHSGTTTKVTVERAPGSHRTRHCSAGVGARLTLEEAGGSRAGGGATWGAGTGSAAWQRAPAAAAGPGVAPGSAGAG